MDLQDLRNSADNYRAMDNWQMAPVLLGTWCDLDSYSSYFRTMNPSNNLPYHNEYHTYCMVLNCWEGAIHENLISKVASNGDVDALLTAALFHDFNHSGGSTTDDLNVTRAVFGLATAHAAIKQLGDSHLRIFENSPHRALPANVFYHAAEAIRITKYPYDGPPVTLIQKIIRDADLMQVYEHNDQILRTQFCGLKQEVEKLHGKKYTNEEWADGCKAFNDAVVWHTDWAKKKAEVLDHAACTAKLQQLLLG